MALTRGDKIIILGAVLLAASVVMGLALLRKPQLFSGAPAPLPQAASPAGSAPAPAAAQVASPPVAPAPTAAPAVEPKPAAPAQAQVPTAPTPAAIPPAPGAAPGQTAGQAGRNALAGDETLERMFAEITKDGAKPAKTAENKPTGEIPSSGPTPVVVAEPQAAPAPVAIEPRPTPPEAKPAGKTDAKAAKAAKEAAKLQDKPTAAPPAPARPGKPEAKPKAPSAPKPAGTSASGEVVRLVAEDKNGEYLLVVHTTTPPTQIHKMFLADPPRMVLDLTGSWTYHGPTTRATGQGFIRQIRVGLHADMFRVVLDMAPDALSRFRGTPTAERVPEGVALRIPK